MKIHPLLIAGCLTAGFANAQAEFSTDVQRKIEQVENGLAGRVIVNGRTYNLKERMDHFKVKGLSLAVVHDYKVVWAKGYGWADEKEKRAVTAETLFEPGSISKSLNAVGALKLVQDKKIDLHADINNYLKSWKFPYDSFSRGKKISLAHLLSHTAGLTVHGFPGYGRWQTLPSVPQILDGKLPANTPAVRSAFEPGIKFQYSGGGTTISQLMITAVTGMPYDKYMFEQVLKPMGMTNSFYTQPAPDAKQKLLATGYHQDGSEVNMKYHVYPEQAAAGLWMTPTDLCNFIIETQLSYEGKSSKVLSPEMTRLMLTPYMEKAPGLGVFVGAKGEGVKYFEHGAGNEGFSGQYFGSLEGGNGVAVFINSLQGGTLLQEVINSVAQAYEWKNFYTPVHKTSIEVPDRILSQYTGTYLFDGMLATILKKDDGYYLLSDGTYSKMYFTSEKEFFNVEFSSEKTFEFDAQGNVTGYLRRVKGVQHPAAVKVTNPDTLHTNPFQMTTMGWYLLENKQFDLARRYIERGLAVSEDMERDLPAVGNLAHCYLFCNQYDKAISQYRKFLKEANKANQYKDMIGQDFVIFKNSGFDKKLMDKVVADLKIKMPKAYQE